MDWAALFRFLLESAIFLTALSLGLRATPSDALCILRHPGNLSHAVLAMNVVMPALALALALNFSLPPPVKIALFALSVSPLPPTLPKKALKAGGRRDYTVGILFTAAVLATVLVPLTVAIGSSLAGIPLRMSASATAAIVFMSVLAPLGLGIVVRIVSPRLAERTAGPIGVLAAAILAAGVLLILFVLRNALLTLVGDGTLLAFVVFTIVGLTVGHLLGGPLAETRVVLALCTASRHPALAAAIVQVNFPHEPMAIAAVVLFVLVCEITIAPYSFYWSRRHQSRQAIAAPPGLRHS
jgi:BASS family bile acid:Na+ symporter